jgi:Probable cobalt transporter subunit (CbtB)
MDDVVSVDRIHVPIWAWVLVFAAALALYLISLDNGLVLRGMAQQAHEFFHDGRHFLGVPCH